MNKADGCLSSFVPGVICRIFSADQASAVQDFDSWKEGKYGLPPVPLTRSKAPEKRGFENPQSSVFGEAKRIGVFKGKEEGIVDSTGMDSSNPSGYYVQRKGQKRGALDSTNDPSIGLVTWMADEIVSAEIVPQDICIFP